MSTQDRSKPDLRTLELNLLGAYQTVWLAMYYSGLAEQNKSHTNGTSKPGIIITASVVAYSDFERAKNTYWSSKWVLHGVFQAIKLDVQKQGWRCNLVASWFLRTGISQRGIDTTPDFAWAKMEDLVRIMMTFASDENKHRLAYLNMPYGIIDLEDDQERGFAAAAVQEVWRRFGEAMRIGTWDEYPALHNGK